MHKKTRFLLLLFMTTLFFTTKANIGLSLEQTWGISPGVNIDYNLDNIDINYSFPPTEYNATGIVFANATLGEEGEIIILSVSDVNNDSIEYDLIKSPYSETHNRSKLNYEKRIKNLMLLPLKLALEEYDLEDIKRGFTGIDHLIVPCFSETWETFDSFDSPFYITLMKEIFAEKSTVTIEALTDINETTNQCIFDWFVNGTFVDNDANTNFDFLYNLKMAYEISTGLLLGMRTDLDINGENNGTINTIFIDSEVTKEGYALDDFKLPTGEEIDLDDLISSLLPGHQWIFLPISGFFLLIIQKIRKKKNE